MFYYVTCGRFSCPYEQGPCSRRLAALLEAQVRVAGSSSQLIMGWKQGRSRSETDTALSCSDCVLLWQLGGLVVRAADVF